MAYYKLWQAIVLGSSGDGGPATSASLYRPNAVAVDSGGILYISDGTSRIRKVSGGTITTVAGGGNIGFSGDGGPAICVSLNNTQGITVDSAGNLCNGDTALSLVPLGDGRWAGTWVPTNVGDSCVQITVQGREPATGVSGTAQRNGVCNDASGSSRNAVPLVIQGEQPSCQERILWKHPAENQGRQRQNAGTKTPKDVG